uniref:Uncharacterized protein n=1 Tax=Leptobrachium leishanense TaxID=445787 RepID=A0A8C5WJX4_9ANUR
MAESGGERSLGEVTGPRAVLERIVNQWVLDYYFHCAIEAFRGDRHEDFAEIRDIVSVLIQRPLESSLPNSHKLRIMQCLSRVEEGEDLDCQFETNSEETPLESAVHILDVIQGEIPFNVDLLRSRKQALKEAAVLVCIKHKRFERAYRIMQKYITNHSATKVLRAEILNIIKTKNVNHPLIKNFSLFGVKRKIFQLFERFVDDSVPFLLTVAEKDQESSGLCKESPTPDIQNEQEAPTSPLQTDPTETLRTPRSDTDRGPVFGLSVIRAKFRLLCQDQNSDLQFRKLCEMDYPSHQKATALESTTTQKLASSRQSTESTPQQKRTSSREGTESSSQQERDSSREDVESTPRQKQTSFRQSIESTSRLERTSFREDAEMSPRQKQTSPRVDVENTPRQKQASSRVYVETSPHQKRASSREDVETSPHQKRASSREDVETSPHQKRASSREDVETSPHQKQASSREDVETSPHQKRASSREDVETSPHQKRASSREDVETSPHQKQASSREDVESSPHQKRASSREDVETSPQKRVRSGEILRSPSCKQPRRSTETFREVVLESDSEGENDDVIMATKPTNSKPSNASSNVRQKKPAAALRSRRRFFDESNDLEQQDTWSDEEELFQSKRGKSSKSSTSMHNSRKQKWSATETEWIKSGIRKYGLGNWKKILTSYPFENRTSVMIKDRWRTMLKLGLDK